MDTAYKKVDIDQGIDWSMYQASNWHSSPRDVSAKTATSPDLKTLRKFLSDAIMASLPDEDDTLRAAAEHHFASGGKMLRGVLSLASALSLGVPRHIALDYALAIEFLHNASLVHDDLCDNDRLRRNRSSVWAAFNRPIAICLGDWMIAQSFAHAAAAQMHCPSSNVTALMAETLSTLSSGQAGEFTDESDIDINAYTAIVSGKTTPLFAAAVEGPLRLAGLNQPSQIAACCKLFYHIGLAYQMANDLEDHKNLSGTNADGDLLRGAPNAVYLAFFDGLSRDEKIAFDSWRKTADREQLSIWLSQIEKSDALARTHDWINEHLAAIEKGCEALTPEMKTLIMPIISHLAASHEKLVS